MIVYLRDLLNDKVTTREDISRFTQAPVVGEISHYEGTERKIVADKTRGELSEQFRIVRTNLRYFLKDQKTSYAILVTSTMPGEGKTFISMNLAAVLAVSGKRTVLIEFDMRKPKISSSLGLEAPDNDLTSFLVGNVPASGLPIPVPGNDNLFLIATSVIPPNPAELMISDRMPELFDYLKQHFDYIVVDSPPMGIVSDARVLMDHCDMSMYVVRHRYTKKKQLKLVNEIYTEESLKNMSIVVNDVKLKGVYGYYGYGYHYGGNKYTYDYSSGYGYGQTGAKGLLNLFKKRSK